MTAERCSACRMVTVLIPLGDGRHAYCLSCQTKVDWSLSAHGAGPALEAWQTTSETRSP